MHGLFLLSACAPPTPEPGNLSTLRAEVAEYVNSDHHINNDATFVSGASDYLERRGKLGRGNLAVIFDIDETVLSNLPRMREANRGYQPKYWNVWLTGADGPAIKPAEEVYKTAIANDINAVFLTVRTEAHRKATARNLRLQGPGRREKLILRPNNAGGKTRKTVIFKTGVRKDLNEKGFTVIASFCDQLSDMEGHYMVRKS